MRKNIISRKKVSSKKPKSENIVFFLDSNFTLSRKYEKEIVDSNDNYFREIKNLYYVIQNFQNAIDSSTSNVCGVIFKFFFNK